MMETTLYNYLKLNGSTFSELHKNYDPILQLPKILLGAIPNVGLIMEIWPTSFRTYNLLAPNLLNLPTNLFQGKSIKKLMGLAMYQSSVGSGCNYCTAHGCSFALRRGVDKSVFANNLNEKEAAVINFSRKMGTLPCPITKDDFRDLQIHCNTKEIEAISMTIVLMGFLNKFMDVVGIELEQDIINDVSHVLEETGWKAGKHYEGAPQVTNQKTIVKKDSLITYLKVIRQGPRVIKLEKQWLKGVPKKGEKIDEFLKESIGHDFPILKRLKRDKLKRVFATILRDNFTEDNSKTGLRTKVIIGLVFTIIAENKYLQNELLTLAKNNNIEISTELQHSILKCIHNDNLQIDQFSFSAKEHTAIKFAIQASKSPTKIENSLIQEITNQFSDQYIVELVTWLSILQALHRLEKLPEL